MLSFESKMPRLTLRTVCLESLGISEQTLANYSGGVSLIISVGIHRELTQCVWTWIFSKCRKHPSTRVASTFKPRGINRAISRKKNWSKFLTAGYLVASHADVLRGSSRVPTPRMSAEPKDKFLSYCSQISAGDHMQIMGDPIGAVEVKVLTSQTPTYKLCRVWYVTKELCSGRESRR